MHNTHRWEGHLILEDILGDSIECLSTVEITMIKELQTFVQEKCYKTYTRDSKQYLEFVLKGKPRDEDALNSIETALRSKQQEVGQILTQRGVFMRPKPTLRKQNIQQILKQRKIRTIKQERQAIVQQLLKLNRSIQQANDQTTTQQAKPLADIDDMNDEEKKVEVRKFIYQKHKQREQRRRRVEQLEKKLAEKEEQLREQQKKKEEEMVHLRRQQILDRKRRAQQQRQQERTRRQQHERQFSKLRSQSTDHHITPQLSKRQYQAQIARKLQTRKQKLNLVPLDPSKLQEHSKRYQQYRQKQEQKRQQRMRMRQSELMMEIKHYSSYDSRAKEQPQQSDTTQNQKQTLRQKLRRVKDYYALIKNRFKPKIDPNKKRQMLNQIEQLEMGGKHIRRSRLQNGSILFEQLPSTNPRLLGIQYLEQAKKMAQHSRSSKKETSNSTPEIQKSQKIDYLSQLRNRNKRRVEFQEELSRFSYDDRVKKVQHRTEMMVEEARRKQALLKHGKFLTPQQILQYKEELDQQYLDIINLKLKLIQ